MNARPCDASGTAIAPRLWLLVIAMVLLGSLARLGLWWAYAGEQRQWEALWPVLGMGLRYDLVVGAITASLVALLTLPLWLAGRRQQAVRAAQGLLVAMMLAFVLAAACEHFYYGFYKTRFDPIVFGLFEDDTAAVLETIWSDYPVVPGLLGLAVAGMGLSWLSSYGGRWLEARWRRPARRGLQVGLVVLQCLLLVLLARGSVGTFPLIRRDVTVSADPFLNALVLNAPLTLYRAARIRGKENTIADDPLVGVQRQGFATLQDAALAAGLPSGDPQLVQAALFPRAPGQPRALAQSPHVVLGLLESFGQDLLHVDGPGNDMLGRLRDELPHGHRFDNFIASQNGTHPVLESVLLGSSISPLTRGRNARLTFDTSAALPFKRAGYRTVFLYGGGSDWRDIGTAFRHQGFDQVYDARDIRTRFPSARGTEWGIYDAWLFQFAQELLEQADARGERMFLVLLTTTNHPPFTLETPHRSYPLDPAALGERGLDNAAELRAMLATYQYQADQFGAFLQALRQQPLGERTVIAAAGDHNLRTHYRYDLPTQQVDVDRVFAWMRVPPAFATLDGAPDDQAFAGHADLVPTLVELAVPGQRYFATGRNLWKAAPGGGEALAQFDRLYTQAGLLFPLDKPRLYRWRDHSHVQVQGVAPDPISVAQVRQAVAWGALRDWHIRQHVLRNRR